LPWRGRGFLFRCSPSPEFGRIDKTIRTLTYLDDETKRRSTLIQLNRGEGRHSLARVVFHGCGTQVALPSLD
jgi:TnpA family transposase